MPQLGFFFPGRGGEEPSLHSDGMGERKKEAKDSETDGVEAAMDEGEEEICESVGRQKRVSQN